MDMVEKKDQFVSSLVCGSATGLFTDLSLYPLDTVKTRLQSADGFLQSGGFRGIYKGFGSVAAGSMPGAALFFVTYESVKSSTRSWVPDSYLFTTHMAGASFGEVVACLIRVPVEVVKQRAMVLHRASSWSVLLMTVKHEGFLGLYRGYWSTVIREVPFSFIQFPLWEFFKKSWAEYQHRPSEPWQSALCGALAGGVAAGITTPLDVAKTRIMLAQKGSDLAKGNINVALHQIYKERGFSGLFAGMFPRILGISLGGAIFLGVYDKAQKIYRQLNPIPSGPNQYEKN